MPKLAAPPAFCFNHRSLLAPFENRNFIEASPKLIGRRSPPIRPRVARAFHDTPARARSPPSSSLALRSPALRRSLIFSAAVAGAVAVAAAAAAAAAMSSKLIPANPADVMVIRNVTPNVVTLSVPFSRFGMLKVGGRATIVRLTSGSLAVFSPVALTPDVKAKVAELGGAVKYIVASDIEHHIFISEWAAAYPGATLVGPEGLQEKRQKATDERIGKEPFDVVFTAAAKAEGKLAVSPEFDADFAAEYVDAHPNKELVFFYRPERILIEADLMFNLPPTEQYSRVPPEALKTSLAERLFGGLQTTDGEAKGAKRFLWYVLSARDRKGFNASVQRINQWDFETIIPCHGDTVEGNGRQLFEKVFDWHLKGHK